MNPVRNKKSKIFAESPKASRISNGMNVLNKFSLKDNVVIVTGGAGLLGREYSRAIAEAGGTPVVADINGKGEEQVDITDKSAVVEFVQKVLKRHGRIDGLVNNAGIDPKFEGQEGKKHTYSFENYPQELWNKSLDVNLTGTFLCSQAVAPIMLKQNKGSIVNISSIYGVVGPDQRIYQKGKSKKQTYKPVDYSVTKSAVLGLTGFLAAYWAGKNIRVNSLTPGGVFNNHDREFVKNYSSKTVLGRMAKKDEYNAAIIFLLSDASSYMTGANLIIDGGFTAW